MLKYLNFRPFNFVWYQREISYYAVQFTVTYFRRTSMHLLNNFIFFIYVQHHRRHLILKQWYLSIEKQSIVMLIKKQESSASNYFFFLFLVSCFLFFCYRPVMIPASSCTLLYSTGLDLTNKPRNWERKHCKELFKTFEVFSGLLELSSPQRLRFFLSSELFQWNMKL